VGEPDGTVVANMRERAEQCRRLADAILDRRTSDILVKMAEEVEADIRRLETGSHPDSIQLIHQSPIQG
jgi:hypothetical protein